VRTADALTLADDIDTFFALFQRARGAKGTFMSARAERFFRAIAAAFLPLGMLRLDVLELAGRPLAVTFGFQSGAAYYLYNMAYDPAAAALSPGVVLLAGLVERAIADRLARFDFLRGLEPYKLALGAAPSDLRRIRVWAR
jgi:CelD/BcsL family acetyltransferase involved in cellulose biosynthesis